MDWTPSALADAGFAGFVPFAELRVDAIPEGPGVYVVMRPSYSPPRYLRSSTAGWFKGKDPSVDAPQLQRAWLPDSLVLYIGKASAGKAGKRGLRTRLREYLEFGSGQPVAHWGGRYIWQLADSGHLLVAWQKILDEDPEAVESRLLAEFVGRYGARPFANRKSGASPERQAPAE